MEILFDSAGRLPDAGIDAEGGRMPRRIIIDTDPGQDDVTDRPANGNVICRVDG